MKQFHNDFDQNTLEAMMERYRAELLRYQRATPPGKPTLEQNLLAVSGAAEAPDRPEPAAVRPQTTQEPPSPDLSLDCLPADAAPPEEDAWEQPAVLVSELQYTPKTDPPPSEDKPFVITQPTPPAFACHTEFEKCIGGFGNFKPYERLGSLTCASFLQTPGEPTDVVVRFAADIPFGAAETSRCRRSFSVRFLCPDGDYDMLGCHLPVAAGSDPELLDAFCAAMRCDPISGLRCRDNFWQLVADHPESLSAVLRLYSDLGTIGSYRMMDGFSLPCYWVNSHGDKSLVRTRWLSRQRPSTLNRFEAEELAGCDPDAVSRDFVTALKNGEKIQYELAAQIIPYDSLDKPLGFDPFDPTDCWCEQQFPLRRLGLLTVNRLPDDFSCHLLPLKLDSKNIVSGIEYPTLTAKGDLSAAAKYIGTLSELDRKTLISNMTDELSRLPADLLEKVLILLTNTDLEFGRDLTSAMGGI